MENRTIDFAYCYIDDVAKDPNWRKTYDSSMPGTFRDPDAYSQCLYDDMLYVWDKLSNRAGFPKFRFESNGKCSIKETTQDLFGEKYTRYAADFIGVNRKQAHLVGIEDSEIVKYLEVQRTLGGHMLFPVRAKLSINQARGCNMLDRFDFTLAEIREYFIHLSIGSGDYQSKYSQQLGESFKKHKKWVQKFCIENGDGIANFKRFIDYWLLDMFVDPNNEYKVFSLVSSDDFENREVSYIETKSDAPYFPGLHEYPKRVSIRGITSVLSKMEKREGDTVREAFEKYIENTNALIEKRNHAIGEAIRGTK